MNSRLLSYSALAGYLLLSMALYAVHPGPAVSLFIFLAATMVMLYTALIKVSSYSYIFLSFFIFMGFWAKITANQVFGIDLLEPVGNFTGDRMSWGLSLNMMTVAITGLVLAKTLFDLLVMREGTGKSVNPVIGPVVSGFYRKYRIIIGLITLVTILGINYANYKYSFYIIGVNPEVVLPFHMNVLLAWLVYFGIAMWLMVLVQWDAEENGDAAGYAIMFLVLLEAFLSGASTMSRIFFLLHALPVLAYIFIVSYRSGEAGALKRQFPALLIFVVMFISNIFLVQDLRTEKYTQPDVVEGVKRNQTYSGENVMPEMNRQIGWLLVLRWIGIEGVQAVSVYPDRNIKTFITMLSEDPNMGANAIYQKISKSHYKSSERYTFLTIPGVIAILGMSGSLVIIMSGMFLLASLLMATEYMSKKHIGSKPLEIFIAMNMAYVVVQMNFPYLSFVFMLQLWVALFMIYFIQKSIISSQEKLLSVSEYER